MVDLEYEGREADIRGMLLRYIRQVQPSFHKERIAFRKVGKKSPAHAQAWGTYSGRMTPDRIVTEGELLELI